MTGSFVTTSTLANFRIGAIVVLYVPPAPITGRVVTAAKVNGGTRGQSRLRLCACCTDEPVQIGEEKQMKYVIAIAALLTMIVGANAEIMCTERGGCWETGKRIRLLNNLRGVEQTLPSRDGNGRVDVRGIPIADDVPHQKGPHFIAKKVR
jgi:hypothetical protein